MIEHAPRFADVAQALFRIACQAIAQQRAQPRGRIGRQSRPVDLARQHRCQRVGHVFGLIAAVAGEHLEHHHAERPDIGAAVDALALCLFRRHVSSRAQDHSDLGGARSERRRIHRVRRSAHFLRRECLGQAEIQHFHRSVVANLDVRRLQIAVDDAALMRKFHGIGDLPRNRQRLVHRNWPLREALGERRTFDQFEDERAIFYSVDGCDVGMVQRRQDLSFASETRQTISVAG